MNDDLISRKELRKAFKESGYFTGPQLHWVRLVIDLAPTVVTNAILEAYLKITDQEFEHSNGFWIMTPKGKKIYFEKKRPQGEWIITGKEQGALGIIYKIRKCSECGWEHSLVIPDNYCPNCGADMRGVEND